MPDATAKDAAAPLLSGFLDEQSLRSHEQLGAVAGVAITVALGGVPSTVGSSTGLARTVDQLQYEVGIGPCLHALATGEGLYVPDLASDDRWGSYGPRAAALGAASCLSIPIKSEGTTAAVFKIYSEKVDGLTESQRRLGHTVAAQLTGGMSLAHRLGAQAEELDDRAAAMEQRRIIDLAVGVLMERSGCSPDEAFGQLRSRSNQANIKLRDAAREVLDSLPKAAGYASAPFRSAESRRRSR